MPDILMFVLFTVNVVFLLFLGLRYIFDRQGGKETLGFLISFIIIVTWGAYSLSLPPVISKTTIVKSISIRQSDGVVVQGLWRESDYIENKFVNLNDYFHGSFDQSSCIKVIEYNKWGGGIYYLAGHTTNYQITPCPDSERK